jgi:hypothetical protein
VTHVTNPSRRLVLEYGALCSGLSGPSSRALRALPQSPIRRLSAQRARHLDHLRSAKDYPDEFVARMFQIANGSQGTTVNMLTAPKIERQSEAALLTPVSS